MKKQKQEGVKVIALKNISGINFGSGEFRMKLGEIKTVSFGVSEYLLKNKIAEELKK